MAVFAFATSKGGAGKTTSAIALCAELNHRGFTVAVIDDDPAAPFKEWTTRHAKTGVSVAARRAKANVAEDIDTARTTADHVVVDLEGVASTSIALATTASDVVIIPMQLSDLDMRQAVITYSTVLSLTAKMLPRPQPVLLLARVNATRANFDKYILSELAELGYRVLETAFRERVIWRQMINTGEVPVGIHGASASAAASLDIANITDELLTIASSPLRPDKPLRPARDRKLPTHRTKTTS